MGLSGHSGICVFGARDCLSRSPLLCHSLPSRMLGSFSLLPVVQSRAALFNNPSCSSCPRQRLLCLSHRFPVSHVVERGRERRIGSRSATICGEREKSRARGGQGRTWGGASKCVSARSVTGVGTKGDPPLRQAALPDCEEGGGERCLHKVGVRGRELDQAVGAGAGAPRRSPANCVRGLPHAYSGINARTPCWPVAEFSFR